MLRHKKVSGLPNTSPDKVGGANWDDLHITPLGGMYEICKLYYDINGATLTKGWFAGMTTGMTRTAAGTYRVNCGAIIGAALPVDHSYSVDILVQIDVNPWGANPAGTRFYVDYVDRQNGFVYIKHALNGTVSDPSVRNDLYLTIIAYPNVPL